MTDLSFAVLRNADMREINACGINAQSADFTGAQLQGAKLDGSFLAGANFSNVTINAHTSFQGAHMAGVNIQGMTMENADGSKAPCTYAMLQAAGATGIGANVAAERANVPGQFASSDMPEKASPSHSSFMEQLGNMPKFATAEVAPEALGNFGKPDTPTVAKAETPAKSGGFEVA